MLAAIKGSDVTGDETWLTAAKMTFADVAANGLTNVPCGGVYWDKSPAQDLPESVIATALFINTAAKLATRYPEQKTLLHQLGDHEIELAPTTSSLQGQHHQRR